MCTLMLTLILGGSLTEHCIDSFAYDPGQQLLTYTEGGILHAQFGIVVFSYDSGKINARTDWVFANGFQN